MHFVQRAARGGYLVGWMFCFTLLTSCGGGPEGNEYVDYDGTKLVVEGTEYLRENTTMDPPGTTLPGRVVLQPEQGRVDDALALIQRYGLALEGRSAEGWLLVKGPAGFEMQWASALQAKLGGLSFATTDSAQSPTPIVTAAADGPAAEQSAPVPDHEPSAADVRRLVIERYERLEKAGGLPTTMTATGQSMVLHSKVFDARKESCRKMPRGKPGEWECSAQLMMSLCSGDCDPSSEEPLPKGERVSIRWDPAQDRFALYD